MIRELAEVIAVDESSLLVATQLKTGCSGCAQQNTCGAGVISKAFADRRAQFRVAKPMGDFRVGEQLELLLPEQTLTHFSLLMYGLPIVVLTLLAMLLTKFTSWPEGWIILTAFAGFGLSFIGLKKWLSQRDIQINKQLKVEQIS
ncbi:SoxR reducing system RseC family protein [Pseudidiomarina sp. WS423]|uniref:SoxR reducing system RseC family protein n=1 Tax=Pseudidiomarina sp. WS423 TaxID=3425124 RepID=UPI003D6EDB14